MDTVGVDNAGEGVFDELLRFEFAFEESFNLWVGL